MAVRSFGAIILGGAMKRLLLVLAIIFFSVNWAHSERTGKDLLQDLKMCGTKEQAALSSSEATTCIFNDGLIAGSIISLDQVGVIKFNDSYEQGLMVVRIFLENNPHILNQNQSLCVVAAILDSYTAKDFLHIRDGIFSQLYPKEMTLRKIKASELKAGDVIKDDSGNMVKIAGIADRADGKRQVLLETEKTIHFDPDDVVEKMAELE